ncbi:MAG: NADPH-dependent FMN reductase [Saprospiraceae bacterium]
MISIISATNRPNSYTSLVANRIQSILKERTEEQIHVVSLDKLPMGAILDHMYQDEPVHPQLLSIITEMLMPSDKFWFVAPEYNGSYPGVLKVFIDACSVFDMKLIFQRKKACLTGIATGRAGNLRGLEHLTGVLHFLKVVVLPNMIPLSSIHNQRGDDGSFPNEYTDKVLIEQVEDFLAF